MSFYRKFEVFIFNNSLKGVYLLLFFFIEKAILVNWIESKYIVESDHWLNREDRIL
jgi:hypothetical protein